MVNWEGEHKSKVFVKGTSNRNKGTKGKGKVG